MLAALAEMVPCPEGLQAGLCQQFSECRSSCFPGRMTGNQGKIESMPCKLDKRDFFSSITEYCNAGFLRIAWKGDFMTAFSVWTSPVIPLPFRFVHESGAGRLLSGMLKFLGKALPKIKMASVRTIYKVLSLCSSKKLIVFLKASTSHEYCNLYYVYNKMNDKSCCKWADSSCLNLSALWLVAHAKIILLDQSSRILSNIAIAKDTTIIQLWHSGGLYKKVGFDAFRKEYDASFEYKRVSRIHGQIDYFVISDSRLIQDYAKAFNLRNEQVVPLGLARTDLIYQSDREKIKNRFYDLHPEARGKKILLYAPTFRTVHKTRTCDYKLLDVNALNKKLGQEWCFAFRSHPTLIDKIPVEKGWIDISKYSYEESILLPDALVTDYSSILFDFSITGNPVFLYMPDIDEYTSTQRMLYVTPENLASKKNVAYSCNELIASILYNNQNANHIFKNYMSSCDGKSSIRIVDFIEQIYRSK